jgi:membrane protease YdiL (CAAX protease family)
MMTAMKDPKNVQTIRILQIAGTFCLMFIPSVMFSWIVNGNNPFWLGFNKYFNVQQIALGFVIIFSANILAGPLQDLSEKVVSYLPSLEITAKNLENLCNDQVQALSHLSGLPDLFLALIIMAFFPALFEELFFRGVMQNLFIKWWKKPILAIIITSIIFSLIHISIYLFLSRIVLGFVLGLMFYKTKNIWVNTIAHFLNNAIAVLQMYALSQSKTKSDIDVSKLDPKFDWWMGLAALAVLYFLFKYLNRYSEENKMKIYTKEQALLVNENLGNPLA